MNAHAALEVARGEGACVVLLDPTAVEQGGEAVVAAVRALDGRPARRGGQPVARWASWVMGGGIARCAAR
jgi:hypothetical protein